MSASQQPALLRPAGPDGGRTPRLPPLLRGGGVRQLGSADPRLLLAWTHAAPALSGERQPPAWWQPPASAPQPQPGQPPASVRGGPVVASQRRGRPAAARLGRQGHLKDERRRSVDGWRLLCLHFPGGLQLTSIRKTWRWSYSDRFTGHTPRVREGLKDIFKEATVAWMFAAQEGRNLHINLRSAVQETIVLTFFSWRRRPLLHRSRSLWSEQQWRSGRWTLLHEPTCFHGNRLLHGVFLQVSSSDCGAQAAAALLEMLIFFSVQITFGDFRVFMCLIRFAATLLNDIKTFLVFVDEFSTSRNLQKKNK